MSGLLLAGGAPGPVGPTPRAAPSYDAARRRRPAPGPLGGTPGAVVALAVLGAGAGLVLTLAGERLGPVAVVALPALLLGGCLLLGRPRWAVLGLAASLPLGQVGAGPVELVQATTAAVLLVVLPAAAATGGLRLPTAPVAVALLAVLATAAMSATQASSTDVAFRLLVQLVLLVGLTVAMTTTLRTPAHVEQLVLVLALAGAAVAGPVLLGAGPTETFYGGGVVTGRAVGIFAQPNELGLFSAVLLVLALGGALLASTRRRRRVALLAAGLLAASLSLSLSRGAWLGALAGLVALAVLVPAARRALLRWAAVALVLVAGLGALGVGPVPDLVEGLAGRAGSVASASTNPYDQRDLIWAEGIRLVGDSPWWGQGPGGYTLPAADAALRDGALLEVEHAHNLLLGSAVEHGLLGLAALLGLCGALVLGLVRSRRSTDPVAREAAPWAAVLVAALVVVLAHGVVDYPLRNPTVLTTVWTVLSLLVVAVGLRAGRGAPSRPPAHREAA